MPFGNPVVGGGGGLIRNWIKSPDFVTGVSGWQIARDGTAEFNDVNVRGRVHIVNGVQEILIANDISPDSGPAINLQPDSSLFLSGFMTAVADDANTAGLQISTPSSLTDGVSADLFLTSGVTGSEFTKIIANAEVFEVFGGFAFEGYADENREEANSADVIPGIATNVVTIGVDAKAGLTYEIKATWHGLGFVGPVAVPGNRATVRITRDGTQIRSNRILAHNTTLTQFGGQLVATDTPGDGSFTYALSLLHEATSTAANVHTVGTNFSPSTISVRGFNGNI